MTEQFAFQQPRGVTNLGGEEAGARPEVLKNGGIAGFGTLIVINPYKELAIFIAVNQSQNNPAPTGVEIRRHLPWTVALREPKSRM